MPSIFNPPLVPGTVLSAKQRRRAAALIISREVQGAVPIEDHVLAAEYIVGGAAGYLTVRDYEPPETNVVIARDTTVVDTDVNTAQPLGDE
jgi:hypothetical protein